MCEKAASVRVLSRRLACPRESRTRRRQTCNGCGWRGITHADSAAKTLWYSCLVPCIPIRTITNLSIEYGGIIPHSLGTYKPLGNASLMTVPVMLGRCKLRSVWLSLPLRRNGFPSDSPSALHGCGWCRRELLIIRVWASFARLAERGRLRPFPPPRLSPSAVLRPTCRV